MARNNARKDELETTEESIVTEATTATIDATESSSVTQVECCAAEEDAGTQETRKGVFSSICGAVQKGIYTGVYGVTYGVVYGALVVGDLIPTNNVVGNGVRDGLAAAKKAYTDRPARNAAADVGVNEGVAAAA